MALAVVVMGVSGAGKSTIGKAIADACHAPFLEGDEFHSAANKAKMAAGIPLEDADRWPWLDEVGRVLGEEARRSGVAFVACSVLKRVYRTRVAAAAGLPIHIIFLDGSTALLEERMKTRKGHFMPASLLTSQLETLERPGGDEDVLTLAIDAPLDEAAAIARTWIEARRAGS